MNIAAGSGDILKQSYYTESAEAAQLLVASSADNYLYVVMGADGNGDTNPSTSAMLRICVEYIGQD